MPSIQLNQLNNIATTTIFRETCDVRTADSVYLWLSAVCCSLLLCIIVIVVSILKVKIRVHSI